MKNADPVKLELEATVALRLLLEQVPAVARLDVLGPTGEEHHSIDLIVHLDAFRHRHTLVCAVKASGQPRHVRPALVLLRDYVQRQADHVTPVFIAPYLSEEAQALCREYQVGFLDLEGNARLAFGTFFISHQVAGKPVAELENVEIQMAMFDRISEASQVAMLETALTSLDEVPASTAKMLAAWNSGDAAGFKTIMDESDAQGPEAYKVIFSDRNATWAEWVDNRLDKPGTVFVAVGTGHLAGRDSVQQWLDKRGIVAKRVN